MSHLKITNMQTKEVVYDSMADHDDFTICAGDLIVRHRRQALPPPARVLFMTPEEAADDERLRDLHFKHTAEYFGPDDESESDEQGDD